MLGAITDILLAGNKFKNDRLRIPGEDDEVDLGDALFNTCPAPSGSAYETLIHEGGHVLGIRNGSLDDFDDTVWTDDVVHHPAINGSVMNYERKNLKKAGAGSRILSQESDCSPHPFDIMAIYALYQTID